MKFNFNDVEAEKQKTLKFAEDNKISENELKSIKAKTLIVNGGTRDIIPISEAKFLASNIEDSKIMILESEGHCTYARKKYWYEDVKDFINE